MEHQNPHEDHVMKHEQHVDSNASNAEMHHMEHNEHQMHGPAKGGEHAAHADHTGHEEVFRKRFWVSLLLSIPVLLCTHAPNVVWVPDARVPWQSMDRTFLCGDRVSLWLTIFPANGTS